MENSKELLKDIVQIKGKARIYRYTYFFISIISELIDAILAFSIPWATQSFQKGHQTLAICFLILAVSNQIIFSVFNTLKIKFQMNYSMLSDVESSEKTLEIFNRVRNKVYITEGKIRRRLTTVEIQENIKNYITKTRTFKDNVINSTMEFVIFVGMFSGTVVTTMQTVSNAKSTFIVMIICIISITLITLRQIKRRRLYFKQRRKLNDELNSKKMDMLNVVPITEKHQNFLAGHYVTSSKRIQTEELKITIKESIEGCYKSGAMSISTIVFLLLAITSYNTLDIGNFANLMALASLYGNMLHALTYEISSIQKLIDASSDKKSYDSMMEIITEKYLEMPTLQFEDLRINTAKVSELDFVHEDTENKVLHRITAHDLLFKSSETTLISGNSGSGKSTFLKIISGMYSYDENNILINNDVYRNCLNNCIVYDPDSNLGTRNILEEITLEESKTGVDKQKLIEILKGLKLYDLILKNSMHEPILDYLTSVYKNNFSSGQIQRFIIARLLYNLDETTNVVILDEPIANLDDKTASHVVEYINEFANKDNSRIVIIASHQIDIVEKICKTKYHFNLYDENYFKIEPVQ